jgi:hypothetical protein
LLQHPGIIDESAAPLSTDPAEVVQLLGRVHRPPVHRRPALPTLGGSWLQRLRTQGASAPQVSDRSRARRPAVLEGEHVVAWVIGGTEQFPFVVMPLAPSAQRGKVARSIDIVLSALRVLPPALSRAWPPTTTRLRRSGSDRDSTPSAASADASEA